MWLYVKKRVPQKPFLPTLFFSPKSALCSLFFNFYLFDPICPIWSIYIYINIWFIWLSLTFPKSRPTVPRHLRRQMLSDQHGPILGHLLLALRLRAPFVLLIFEKPKKPKEKEFCEKEKDF